VERGRNDGAQARRYRPTSERYVLVEMGSTASGTVLDGRYRVLEPIGRGGMADVYRATDERLERLVAVKWLRQTVDDPQEEARARSEALLLARLSHPALVTLFDAGVEEGRPFLVMELIDGPSLAVRAPTDPDSVALVGAQLADGLAYIHHEGLVHRDLKPANVLVAPTATPWERVKLADFGIARLVDAARLTATGTAIGTAAYVAPEQIRADPAGPAADIWSLGLVLLECLTGTRAYPGPPAEAALARLHRPPAIPTDLPVEWNRLLRRMTDPDPARRPSAAELAQTLSSMHGTDAPTTAAGPSSAAAAATGAAAIAGAAATPTAARASTAANTRATTRLPSPDPMTEPGTDNPWGAPPGPAGPATEILPEGDLDRAFVGPTAAAGAGARHSNRTRWAIAAGALAGLLIVALAIASAVGGGKGGGGPTTTVAPTARPATTAPAPATTVAPVTVSPATGPAGPTGPPAPKKHGGGGGGGGHGPGGGGDGG
jgi:eukaryotic-like serine/threonine-protein kinase